MKNYRSISLLFLSLIILTCSKESDVASNAYASSASQNTYTPPTNTTTVTQFTLAVTAAEGGSVSSSGGTYDDGTSLSITATPNEGYRFTGWEGSDSTSESLTVTLNSNQTYQALFELVPVSVSVYTISVTAQGSANYILSGDDANGSVSGNDPSVSLKVGDTLNFNVNAQGHPFYLIKTSNGGFGSSNLIDGVSNNGTVSATVSWTPTEAGTYYYICEYHPSMLGTITVTE